MITIAHRLNTIMHSDRILVLSFGEKKDFDAPAILIEQKDSEFALLVQELKKEQGENTDWWYRVII